MKEPLRSKYDEALEQAERIDYLVYKGQHDILDKVCWETFTGTPWPGSIFPSTLEEYKTRQSKKTQ